MSITHHISKIWHSTSFREVVRFGIVGCVATLIQYAIYYLFNQCIGWGATTSLTIGYAVSFVFNFSYPTISHSVPSLLSRRA